jgi:preprotein translocase subunit YajC
VRARTGPDPVPRCAPGSITGHARAPSDDLYRLEGTARVAGFEGLLLPVAFIAVLYFVLIRPQQKRQKQHQALIRDLQVGDDVVTIGGLHGRVLTLTDDTMDLEVTDDVVLRFQRSSLAKVVRDEPLDPSTS